MHTASLQSRRQIVMFGPESCVSWHAMLARNCQHSHRIPAVHQHRHRQDLQIARCCPRSAPRSAPAAGNDAPVRLDVRERWCAQVGEVEKENRGWSQAGGGEREFGAGVGPDDYRDRSPPCCLVLCTCAPFGLLAETLLSAFSSAAVQLAVLCACFDANAPFWLSSCTLPVPTTQSSASRRKSATVTCRGTGPRQA